MRIRHRYLFFFFVFSTTTKFTTAATDLINAPFSLSFNHFFDWRDLRSISPTFYEQLISVQIPKAQKDSKVKAAFCAFAIL